MMPVRAVISPGAVVRPDRLAVVRALLPYVAALGGALVVGIGVAGERPLASSLTKVLVVGSCAVIALSLEPEHLFIGWLALAPFFQESARATSIGHDMNLAYKAVPLLLMGSLAVKRGRQRLTPTDVLPAVYLVYVLLSGTLISSVTPHITSIYQTTAIGIFVYWFIVFGQATSRLIERVARVLIGSAIVVSVMTIVEHVTNWNLWHDNAWHQATDNRAVATLANPAVLGTFLGIGIAFALAILAWDGPRSLRTPSIILLVVAFPALFFTLTRGPMVAVALVVLFLVFTGWRAAWPGFMVLLIVTAFLVASWGRISSSPVYRSRFMNQANPVQRIALQDVSIKLAEQKPLLGWGFGSFDQAKRDLGVTGSDPTLATVANATSHDTFLTTLVELGPPGLLLFLATWIVVAWRSVKRVRYAGADRWLFAAALGALGVYVVSAGTLDMRFFSFVPMLAWLAAGLARRRLSDTEMQAQST
jgi:O-antigen ligase